MGKLSSTSKKSKWVPPEGASAYFHASSDYEFKKKHPVGYVFLVILGLIAFITPIVIYGICVISTYGNGNENTLWFLFGIFGSMAIGIGLFNFVAIIINQYLGHLVSIVSFLIGGIMIAISLQFL